MSVSATHDTVLPLSKPIRGANGKLVTQLAITAGTEVSLGMEGCNMSQEFWGEDALEWNPERSLRPMPETISQAEMPGVSGVL